MIPVVLAIALFAACTPANADSFGYDQLRYSPGEMGVVFDNPAKRMATAFTLPPEMNGKSLSSVKYYVVKTIGFAGPLVVELRNDENGYPGSTILAQGSATCSAGWASVNVAPVPVLQSGVRYHAVIRAQTGYGDEDNNVRVCYMLGRYRPDMAQELDFGSGWFTHPRADPATMLVFSDGSKFGQGYTNVNTVLPIYSVYGVGSYCKYGERIWLHAPMLVRKVSFVVERARPATASLRLVIQEEISGIEIVNEVFTLPDDCSSWDPVFQSHELQTPVLLEANKGYKMYLTQDPQSTFDTRYIVIYQQNESSTMSFGGAECYTFAETASGAVTPYYTHDAYFRLDTKTLELTRSTLHLVTGSSVTLVVETNVSSDVELDYGTTTGYGNYIESFAKTVHQFDLSGLAPGTAYHYRLIVTNTSDPTDVIVTDDRRFRTDPGSGPIDVCVIGDTQSMDPNTTVGQAASYPRDIVVTVGDNVGLQELHLPNEPRSYDIAKREWQWFLRDISPLTENAPLYTALGNHDAGWTPQVLAAYRDSVIMPSNGNGMEQYYSFDYGPAHFVVLDDVSFSIDTTQLNWLSNDLAASTKPWKIAILHVPLYGAEPNWIAANAQATHNILRDRGVQLVLQGHRHVYNRYVKDGVCYAINSTASLWGNGIGADGFQYGFTYYASMQNSGGDPGTIAAYISRPGWMQLNITDTRLHSEFIDPLGRVLDAFTLPMSMVLTFNPDGGQFSAPTSVAVACDTPDAEIHYTTNGREPTVQDPVVASGGSVTIAATLTLKAKAFKNGSDPSDTKSSEYIMKAATPTFGSQWVSSTFYVTMSCASPNATIRYTLNGVDPTLSHPVAAGPVPIPFGLPTTVKAKAWAVSMRNSDVAAATYGSVMLVRKGAPGPVHDGKTWTTAFLTITDALNLATPGSEIWVAGSALDTEAGTYYERLTLFNGVTILGGFAGNEISKSQRDPSAYDTIIDGGGGGSVITAPAEITSVTTLDGFVAKNGSGKPISGFTYGGGVYCAGSPVINSLVVTGNNSAYGAGIYCETGASPTITNCQIVANSASQQGGGIYVSGGPSIRNNTIADNTAAGDGGGIYCNTGNTSIVNNVIAFNSSGIKKAAGAPYLGNNCLYGNTAYSYLGLSAGSGDISSDPGFSARSSGIYRLSGNSPCIDAADNSSAPGADGDGNSRPVDGNSDGTAVADIGSYERAWKSTTIVTAKGLKDYTPVSLFSGVVTAVLPDRFYLEASNRIGAIGVLGSGAAVGKTADVRGEIVTVDGEKMISASSVSQGPTAASPNPLAVSLQMLGGGAFSRQKGVNGWTRSGQRKAAEGVNNVAMLVRCVGKIASSGSGYFYLDDGSDVSEGSQATKGVRVNWPYAQQIPPTGSTVSVTAISSCRIVNVSGSDYVVRMLRPISADAIVTLRLP